MDTENMNQAEMMEPGWAKLKEYMDNKTVIEVTVDGVSGGGLVSNVEGVRGFIPASLVALKRVDDLNDYLLKELKVIVTEVDESQNRLILSAKDVLKQEARAAKKDKINSVKVGSVFDGKVESLKDFGAFVDIGDGLSGLVHVSQISTKRIKTPEEVLKVGDEVKVKVIAVKDGKLSLSIKALAENPAPEKEEVFKLPKAESATTSLGDLFKGIKLDQ
ncbi:MAG: S1 RNA-binding domain-containing protein [Lachnospiraceae bacterium]|nr:S1 RNA-binding domain-containing protein [Lachnospiraceae bacterium]